MTDKLTPEQREALSKELPGWVMRKDDAFIEAVFAAGIAYATKRDAAICRALKHKAHAYMIEDREDERCALAIEEANHA